MGEQVEHFLENFCTTQKQRNSRTALQAVGSRGIYTFLSKCLSKETKAPQWYMSPAICQRAHAAVCLIWLLIHALLVFSASMLGAASNNWDSKPSGNTGERFLLLFHSPRLLSFLSLEQLTCIANHLHTFLLLSFLSNNYNSTSAPTAYPIRFVYVRL